MALFEVEAPTRVYRPAVLSNDGLLLVFLGFERNRDCFYVFQSQTGVMIHKFLARYQGAKDCTGMVPIPGKQTQVALIDQEKGALSSISTLIRQFEKLSRVFVKLFGA